MLGTILNFFGIQYGAAGGNPVGVRLTGSLFVPSGYGIVFTDSSGLHWRLSLATDADGNTIKDESGYPQTQLVQITLP